MCLPEIPSTLPDLHLPPSDYIFRFMLLLLFRTLFSALRSHRALALENLALRHQLELLKRNTKRPHIKNRDRLFWILFARFFKDWRKQLLFVRPETVIRWHKEGFRRYWKWKSVRNGREERRFPGIFAILFAPCLGIIPSGELPEFTENH